MTTTSSGRWGDVIGRSGGTPSLSSARRSSFCTDGHCVAVAEEPEGVALVDTKDLSLAPLQFTRAEWASFVLGVKNGEFDPA